MTKPKLEIEHTQEVNWNDWAGFVAFQRTPVEYFLEKIPHKIVALFTGNQAGKTKTICGNYLPKALMGRLPHKEFNILPEDNIRIVRLASENLPNDAEGGEVRNTLYPAVKESIPNSWIKKDITIRKPVMSINPPVGGGEVQLEYVSYNQDTQAMAGVQRKLIILDELPPYEFYQEQLPRLLAADGRLIIMLTSINANWTYEEIFERARTYIRTPIVIDAYKRLLGKDVPKVEKTDSPHDICVIQAATDDNPIWKDLIKRKNLQITVDEYITRHIVYDDPDMIAMRRYGIFKQISGAIFKDFQWDIHFINGEKYFPSDVPDNWRHGRMIDFHEENPWAVIWLALSPENEAFVWKEYAPAPTKNTALPIAETISEKTGDIVSQVDLIDPLAAKNQPSISRSVLEDLNRIFFELRRQNRGTGGYWRTWDTKSLKGRDAVKERLKNAKLVGKPFNNKVVREGRTEILPTLWIFDNCKQTALSLKNWRVDEWADRNAAVTKDAKEKPQQKWSHFCMCLEAAFKHVAFQSPPRIGETRKRNVPQAHYGQRRGR